ncbi:MAG: TIGR04282 family arsenosugar biosynthesis glycosyltransferase [Solirubrobacteraceae bacterium]
MPAALVLARSPVPGACKTRLEPLLGPEGCARLQAVLVARAARWAQLAAPDAAFVSFSPADAVESMSRLVPDGVRLFPQVDGGLGDRIAAAAEHVLGVAGGPLLVAGADVVALGPEHAAAAFDDLAHGCDLTIGPATDGGYYLIGLGEPRPDLFALAAEEWGGPQVLRLTLTTAASAGLRVGLLRAERDLDEPADVRALLADPLTPDDVRAALGGETR